MKPFATYLLFAATLFITPSCHHNHDHGDDELAHHHHEHAEGASHEGEEIVLEPEVAQRFGVEVDTIAPTSFSEVLRVAGKIVGDPRNSGVAASRTPGIVSIAPGIAVGKHVSAGTTIARIKADGVSGGDTNAAARATMQAAKRELDRITPLHEKGIVSTRQYNEALLAYEQARAAYSPAAASGVVTSPVDGVITSLLVTEGTFVDAGTPIAEISSTNRMILKADVPERHRRFLTSVADARIIATWLDEPMLLSEHGGTKISSANTGETPSPGYLPVYFSFNASSTPAFAGAPVEVVLLGDSRLNVISVPLSAISEQQGEFFVYRRIDDECYLKTPVTTGLNDGTKVEIVDGLAVGDVVVTKGTTTVRLAETSSVVPEGHSHSH